VATLFPAAHRPRTLAGVRRSWSRSPGWKGSMTRRASTRSGSH